MADPHNHFAVEEDTMSKAQLIKALAALDVPEGEYKGLTSSKELEALLKQKQAEKAMQDAENGGDGEEDEEAAAPADSGDDPADDDPDDVDPGADTKTDDPPEDETPNEDPGDEPAAELTKLRARAGFEVTVIDVAVANGKTVTAGKKLKVKADATFHAGEQTRDHLLEYRVAERA